jgi:hypothetical protein
MKSSWLKYVDVREEVVFLVYPKLSIYASETAGANHANKQSVQITNSLSEEARASNLQLIGGHVTRISA